MALTFEKLDYWTQLAIEVDPSFNEVLPEKFIFFNAPEQVQTEISKNLITNSDKKQRMEYLYFVHNEAKRVVDRLDFKLRGSLLETVLKEKEQVTLDGVPDDSEDEIIPMFTITDVKSIFTIIISDVNGVIENERSEEIGDQGWVMDSSFELEKVNHRLILLHTTGMFELLFKTFPNLGLERTAKLLATIMGVDNLKSFRGEVGKLRNEAAGIKKKPRLDTTGKEISQNKVMNPNAIRKVNQYLISLGIEPFPEPLKEGDSV